MSRPSNNGTDADASTVELSASDRHELLVADRRRLTLDILAGNTTPVELEELAAGIAAREDGIDAVDEETIERAAIDLHHAHLPKMAELGVLEYDPETRRIDPSGIAIDSVHPDYFDRR